MSLSSLFLCLLCFFVSCVIPLSAIFSFFFASSMSAVSWHKVDYLEARRHFVGERVLEVSLKNGVRKEGKFFV